MIITLTQNFRIVQSEREYTLQQLHMIDPKNSPRFDPEKHSSEIRQEWKDAEAGHYSLTPNGLRALLKYVATQEIAMENEELHIKEYLKLLKEFVDKLNNLVKE